MTYLRSWPQPDGATAAGPFLLCLPQAGAGAGHFRDWQQRLGATATVLAVQLPGREDRWSDPAPAGVAEVARAVAGELASLAGPGRPVVIFGDSFGGLIGYELARLVDPAALVACVCRAPGYWARQGGITDADVDRLATAASEGADLPPTLAAELRELAAEVLHRDAALSATFRLPPDASLLHCPVHAWGAAEDPTVTASQLDDWGAVTTGPLYRHDFAGGHRVSRDDPAAVLGMLSQVLAAAGVRS